MPLMDVISDAIRYLKEIALELISKQNSSVDIQWVITVPAIWNAKARHFMRKAAEQVC